MDIDDDGALAAKPGAGVAYELMSRQYLVAYDFVPGFRVEVL